MLTEESLQPVPESSTLGDQTRPRSRRTLLAGVAALVVVALLALTLLAWIRANATASISTADWQTYRDPLGLFSIQAPPDWSVEHDTNSGTFGDRTGSYSYTGEEVWLGVPPRNVDGFGVFINVVPLTTDFARGWMCRGLHTGFPTNTTIGGVPAYHDGLSMW